MSVEPTMREPGLRHHSGDANPTRPLRPYCLGGFPEDSGPGPLLVFGIIPYGPPLYDCSNLIIWPLQALTAVSEQTSVSKGLDPWPQLDLQ